MIDLRAETPADHDAVRELHTRAFGGATEARLVDRLRGAPGSLSLVSVEAGIVTGHILFTAITLAGGRPGARVAGLGPMAVHPALQRRGIGSALVAGGLEECRRAGYEAVVVVGHPEYYPRFGFGRGSGFGLRSESEVPDDVFMALELAPGALRGGGEARFAPEFAED